MRQTGEPSVEEILESIKKVIARDNREGAAEQRRQRESNGMASAEIARDTGVHQVEDVLDLVTEADFDDADDDADDGGEAEAPLVTEEARVSMREFARRARHTRRTRRAAADRPFGGNLRSRA